MARDIGRYLDAEVRKKGETPTLADLTALTSKAEQHTIHKLQNNLLRIPHTPTNICEAVTSLQRELGCVHHVCEEERRQAMAVEAAKRLEAANLAKRLRAEQEERDRKREEALRHMHALAAEEAAKALEAEVLREREREEEKQRRVLEMKELAERRKEYLDVLGKRVRVRKSLSEPRVAALPRLSTREKVLDTSRPTKHYEKSAFLRQLEAEQKAALEQAQLDASLKQRRLDMQKHYSSMVKEMFAPTIDQLKRKEMELIQHRSKVTLHRFPSPRKSWQPIEKQSTSVSVTPVKSRKKTHSSEPKHRIPRDFLRDVREDLDRQLRKALQCDLTPTEHTAQWLEAEARKRMELRKRVEPLTAEAMKLEEDADTLMLFSVKAKLAMLQA